MAVVYDFSPSRAGEHARNFLGSGNGKLVCDDFAGYKAGFELGVTQIGCMAYARKVLRLACDQQELDRRKSTALHRGLIRS